MKKIESYAELLEIIANSNLIEGVAENCHYLSYSNRAPGAMTVFDDAAQVYQLGPIYFDDAFMGRFHSVGMAQQPPAWVEENFIAITHAFTLRGAYGSVIALVQFLKNDYPNAIEKLIDKINLDRQSPARQLGTLDYNFLFIASIYLDLPQTIWQFLLEECGADINFYTQFQQTPLHYALNKSSHATRMAFMHYGVKHGLQITRTGYKNKTTALSRLVDQIFFEHSAQSNKTQLYAEIEFLLQYDITLMSAEIWEPEHKRGVLLADAFAYLPHTSQIIPLLIQHGAGLMHKQYREIPAKNICYMQLIPGFDLERYNAADVVLTGKDIATMQWVWLYGMEEIKSVLRNPDSTITLEEKNIASQLQAADPSLLGSNEVLAEFLHIPSLFEVCVKQIFRDPRLVEVLQSSGELIHQDLCEAHNSGTLSALFRHING